MHPALHDIPAHEIQEYLWTQGYIGQKLWKQQQKIYETIRSLPAYLDPIVVLCSRQFGKSFLGTLMAVEDCLRYPGFTVCVVGPTIKQTVDIVHQAMKIIEEDAPAGLIERSKAETRWHIGHSELIVGGFDTKTATRQRGKRALKVYVEEVVDSNPDQYREAIRSDLGPMLTHSPEPQMIFLTTPPKVPDHPFITETIPEAKLNDAFFLYTIDDNAELNQEQYDACVKRSGGKSTVEFRREYMCEIIRDANIVVVPDFDPKRHVFPIALPQSAKYQLAVDFGGVRDLTVGLLSCHSFLDAKDYILDERVFQPNTPTEQIVYELRKMEAGFDIEARFADVPGQLQIDLNNYHNYPIQMPPKDDWAAAVNSMAVAFSTDRIQIDPKCSFLIQSLESGTFNRNRTDFERTKALGHCDALAALTYGLRTQDRSNPFRSVGDQSRVMFYRPAQKQEPELHEALQPVSFSTSFDNYNFKAKKFGRFKR